MLRSCNGCTCYGCSSPIWEPRVLWEISGQANTQEMGLCVALQLSIWNNFAMNVLLLELDNKIQQAFEVKSVCSTDWNERNS